MIPAGSGVRDGGCGAGEKQPRVEADVGFLCTLAGIHVQQWLVALAHAPANAASGIETLLFPPGLRTFRALNHSNE